MNGLNNPVRAVFHGANRSFSLKLICMKKLLLTAFEPFGGSHLNASQEVARAPKEHRFEGVQIEVLELPVVRFRALELTIATISRLRPYDRRSPRQRLYHPRAGGYQSRRLPHSRKCW
jgi:hypothetical protein